MLYHGANLLMTLKYPGVDVFEEVGRLNELYYYCCCCYFFTLYPFVAEPACCTPSICSLSSSVI